MTTKTSIIAEKAPAALGPYSAAVRVGDMLYCSGQTGISPVDGELVGSDVASQARQVLANLSAVLEAAGLSMDAVVKTTVFLTDMNDFAQMNAIYAEHFSAPYPARSTVQVAALPKGGCVEIEAIAAC